MASVNIQSVATAVPDYRVSQADVKKFAAALFKESFKELDRLLVIFDKAKIQARYVTCPIDWYGRLHSLAEANAIYEEVALRLAEEAALKALAQGGVDPAGIGMIIFVSSTGIATPTLDAKLIQKLGLSPHTVRLPVWGLGCAGGVAGIARAAEMAGLMPGKAVLMVTVELCSLTFQYNDRSKSNLVGAGIFADGAAAAVLMAGGCGPAILGSYSTLFDDSEDVMGWDVVDTGLKVRFSRDIPAIVRNHLPGLVTEGCQAWGVSREKLRYFITHPGGAKVLEAYITSLELRRDALNDAYYILENYGNMSSSTVLFVLERFLNHTRASGDYGLMLTLGPGFSAEQVLFQW